MHIWRELLRLSSELLDQSGHAAIDATYFDRRQATSHYLKRCDRTVRTVQATFLVDTAHGAVIDVHCSTKWPNGTNIGPQVALRNAGVLLSLAADKGYDDMSFREELRTEGVRPLIKHRVFAPYDHAHNARINDERYNQRSVYETVNSVIKRSYGSAVPSASLVPPVPGDYARSSRLQRRTSPQTVNPAAIGGFNEADLFTSSRRTGPEHRRRPKS
jgi:IS5 family transposase